MECGHVRGKIPYCEEELPGALDMTRQTAPQLIGQN